MVAIGALLGVLATPAQALVTYGALLWSGMHVLTAAHCLTDSTGNNTADSLSVIFQTADGSYNFV